MRCAYAQCCLLRRVIFGTQIYSELNQNQSLRFLDPLGSLLDGCAVDEATAAAASPAFMCGAVLLPLTDILVCQVSRTHDVYSGVTRGPPGV
jgi:hypothetical protein